MWSDLQSSSRFCGNERQSERGDNIGLIDVVSYRANAVNTFLPVKMCLYDPFVRINCYSILKCELQTFINEIVKKFSRRQVKPWNKKISYFFRKDF